jgi:Flp pilus assembly protein TadD
MSARSNNIKGRRLIGSLATVLALAGTAAGCMTGRSEPPAMLAMASARTDADWRSLSATWGERYRATPNDPVVAINYAEALRKLGQRAQATAVLEQATIANPKNMELLGAFGRALADAGNLQQALDVLNRSHTPDRPDWRVLSVQGAVLDQMGQHADAQNYYASALRIAPEEPSVLSNLGLSYALSKDLTQAEATLRRAAAAPRVDPRVRQNLALVLGLQGRFAEAEAMARADLPPEEAAANVAYLKQMLAQQKAAPAKTARPDTRGSRG